MIEGLQHENISLDKGIVRTPSLGVDGELSECVNLIPHGGEMTLIREPEPIMDEGNWLLYTCVRAPQTGIFVCMLAEPAPCDIPLQVNFTKLEDGELATDSVTIEQGKKRGTGIIRMESVYSLDSVVVGDRYTTQKLKEAGYLGLKPYRSFEFSTPDDVEFVSPEETALEFPRNYRLLATHYVDRKINYILLSTEEDIVYYRQGEGYTFLRDAFAEVDVAVLGQTLVLTSGVYKYYYLWDGDHYKEQNILSASVEAQISLGETRPYKVNANSFTSSASGRNYKVFVSHGVTKYTKDAPDFIRSVSTSGSTKTWRLEADKWEIKDYITDLYGEARAARKREGAACFPFYVRYGVELYDGSVVNLSAPILMTPSTIIKPRIGCWVPSAVATWQMEKSEKVVDADEGAYDNEAYTFVPMLTARYLYAAFDASALEGLSSDLIKGIALYATKEIELSGGELVEAVPSISLTSTELVTDGLGNEVNRVESDYGTITPDPPYINYMYTYPDSSLYSENAYKEFTDPVNFYRLALIPYSFLEGALFKVVAVVGGGKFRNISSAENWADSDYTDEDLEVDNYVRQGYRLYSIDRGLWSTLTSQPSLSSVLKSQNGVVVVSANSTYNYNSRLIYGGFTEKMSPHFSVSSFLGDSRLPSRRSGTEATIYLADGSTFKTLPAQTGYLKGYNGEALAVFSPYDGIKDIGFEAGIYHGLTGLDKASSESVGGYAMYTSITSSSLLENDDLSVRYAFDPFAIPERYKLNNMHTDFSKGHKPNAVAVTKVSNPWVIEAVYELACGEILAISSATEAISQGQFGDFPLYAFTDNGIYALSIGSTGTIEAKQPISREVISVPNMVLQLDNAVAFPTKAGLQLLSGGEVISISDNIKGHNIDEAIFDLPEELALPDKLPFEVQLQDCKMVYDGINKQIHVFNEEESVFEKVEYLWDIVKLWATYTDEDGVNHRFTIDGHSKTETTTYRQKHYVFSLATKQWTSQILGRRLEHLVHGYPYSVLQLGNTLYQYSEETNLDQIRQGWLLTRPIAFGDLFTKKVLADLRVFGQKTNDGTAYKIQVYTSEDRKTWHRLNSLKSRSAKWYRFLIKADMCSHDTLSGIACQYAPRLGHKFR